jgi:hypothetical protein
MDALATSLLMLPFALTMFISGKAAERLIQQGRPAIVLAAGAAVPSGSARAPATADRSPFLSSW